jgi:hypothetical protein
MPESLEMMSLRTGQLAQIQDQFRVETYNMQLKFSLLMKMLEEKGILVKDEFEKRWPLYLKNDVGAIGPDGMMDGSLSVKFYGMD